MLALASTTKDDVMTRPLAHASDTITFGPFTLAAKERLLLRQGAPVDLGTRAFDILAILAARPNEIVSKKDLLASVWPDVTVEEGSLRFHMANLRKALGDGKDGARYIATLTGRGYSLVAPRKRAVEEKCRKTSSPATRMRICRAV
jgi:DNA-binding winged helix-turn-helix (wHTH) protein